VTTTTKTLLVTGANRGIGLAVTGHLVAAGHRVVAACRRPGDATELAALGVPIVGLDLADNASIAVAPSAVAAHVPSIDVLVHNAGIKQAAGAAWEASAGPMPNLDADAIMTVLRTNVVGTLLTTQALRPLLVPGAVVAHITSLLGSLSGTVGIDYAYNASKAALNMVTVTMQRDVGLAGITPVAINPGWIRTSMGGDDAPLDLETASKEIADLLARLDATFAGRFVDRFGDTVPW
jgi:NAD(P)-dependent dehydrogenase (short-subunit alcohol dehydrogenase family)